MDSLGSQVFEQGEREQVRQNEVFRDAMLRAAEKQKEGARARAAMARLQRQKVEVSSSGASWGVLFPALVAGLWVINFAIMGGK